MTVQGDPGGWLRGLWRGHGTRRAVDGAGERLVARFGTAAERADALQQLHRYLEAAGREEEARDAGRRAAVERNRATGHWPGAGGGHHWPGAR